MTEIRRKAVLLVGLRKCGTTALYHALARHPGVDPGAVKEPQFFALTPELVRDNLDWYESLFQGSPDGAILDASTHTFLSPEAPSLIRECVSEPRVLLVVRDPVRRLHSLYLHMHKEIPRADHRTFDEVLDALEEVAGAGEDLLAAEEAMVEEASSRGRLDPGFRGEDPEYYRRYVGAPFPYRFARPLGSFLYLWESRAHPGVQRYREILGDRVLVVVFERMIRDPEGTLDRILAFAGLDGDPGDVALMPDNPTRVPRGNLSRFLLSLKRHPRVAPALTGLIRRAGLRGPLRRLRNRVLMREKPLLDRSRYQRTRALLAPEYEAWFADDPELKELWRWEPGS